MRLVAHVPGRAYPSFTLRAAQCSLWTRPGAGSAGGPRDDSSNLQTGLSMTPPCLLVCRFVPMGRTGEAVQLLQVVVQKSQGHSTKPGDSRVGILPVTVKPCLGCVLQIRLRFAVHRQDWDQLLDCCLEMIPDPIETSPVLAACDTSKCGLSQGTTVTLQLLPCSTWLASLGGSRTQVIDPSRLLVSDCKPTSCTGCKSTEICVSLQLRFHDSHV